jgi:hypothetical protein
MYAKDIFRRMRPEKHSDGDVIGDVTNDSAHQRSYYIINRHKNPIQQGHSNILASNEIHFQHLSFNNSSNSL